MLTERLKKSGLVLKANGDKLIVKGKPLTDEQRSFIRKHKPQILAELKAANQDDPSTRLRAMAPAYRIDPDELLNWYANDMDMIQSMDGKTLDALVRDYAANRATFRGERPWQAYRLWYYKITRNAPGYVRQGLMTDNPEDALHRLEAIYGEGSVFDLHQKGEQP